MAGMFMKNNADNCGRVEAFYYNEQKSVFDICSERGSGYKQLIYNDIKTCYNPAEVFIDFNCELLYKARSNQILSLTFRLCRVTEGEKERIKTWDYIIDTNCRADCSNIFEYATRPPFSRPDFCIKKNEIIRFTKKDIISCGEQCNYLIEVKINNCTMEEAQIINRSLYSILQKA